MSAETMEQQDTTSDESQVFSTSQVPGETLADRAGEHNVALKELVNVTAQSLSGNVASYFSNLYKKCMAAEQQRKKDRPDYPHDATAIFKNELNTVMKWEQKQAAQRAEEIKAANPSVENLLEDIVITHFNLLRNVRARKVASLQGKTLERPTFAFFILSVFKEVSSRLYQKPEIANRFTKYEALNEFRWTELKKLTYHAVKDVLKTIMPVNKILDTLNQIRKEQVDLERLQQQVLKQQQQQQQPQLEPEPELDDEFAATPPTARKEDDTEVPEEKPEEDEEPDNGVKPIPANDIGDMPIEEAVRRKLTTIPGSGFAPVDTKKEAVKASTDAFSDDEEDAE